jgi:hypothetical protein
MIIQWQYDKHRKKLIREPKFTAAFTLKSLSSSTSIAESSLSETDAS